MPEAHAAQRGDGLVPEPARRERHRAERACERARVRNRDAVGLRRKHVRRGRGRRRGERIVEAERGDFVAQASQQRREPAEQRQARADFEQDRETLRLLRAGEPGL